MRVHDSVFIAIYFVMCLLTTHVFLVQKFLEPRTVGGNVGGDELPRGPTTLEDMFQWPAWNAAILKKCVHKTCVVNSDFSGCGCAETAFRLQWEALQTAIQTTAGSALDVSGGKVLACIVFLFCVAAVTTFARVANLLLLSGFGLRGLCAICLSCVRVLI